MRTWKLVNRILAVLAIVSWSLQTNVRSSYLPKQLYAIQVAGGQASYNPADSTTYYFCEEAGLSPSTLTPSTTANGHRLISPVTGTVVAAYGAMNVTLTLGSAETSTISVRNQTTTTDATVSSTVKADATDNYFGSATMSLAVTAGDELFLKWVTPAWATNPQNVFVYGTILIAAEPINN